MKKIQDTPKMEKKRGQNRRKGGKMKSVEKRKERINARKM